MTARFYRLFEILVLASLTLSVLYGDVTARYKTEMTMNPALSALAAGATKGADLAAPQEMTLRLKGGKEISSTAGFTSILDLPSKEMIVLDPATMRYAKMTYAQFVDEAAVPMPEPPAEARTGLATMKVSVSPSKLTGQTEVIQGVEAEEREMVVSIDGSAIPSAPDGPSIRMVMQLWTAKPVEALRVPAIHELSGYSLYSYVTMNPLASVEKMMKQLPGFANVFEPMVKELQSGTTILRMHVDMFMPGTAAMLRKDFGSAAAGGVPDDGAPFLQMNQELVELSTAPVPDSIFQIPEGYQEASASELVQAVLAKSKAAVRQ